VEFSPDFFIQLLLFSLGGMTAGVINTLAGNGTVITLPLLVFLGLPPQTANGTNRIGVIMQGLVAFTALRAQKSFSLQKYVILIIPCLMTAAGGAYTATVINPALFNKILAVVMLIMLFLVLQKPEKWLREHEEEPTNKRFSYPLVIIFMILGFYGGFIQAGMGVLILVSLVLFGNISQREANSIKAFIIVLINIPAILIFIWQGQVHWLFGLMMGAGQSAGAWLTVRLLMDKPQAGLWVRRVLIGTLILASIKFAFF
jgi:uncharacterized membrane protein YfcA